MKKNTVMIKLFFNKCANTVIGNIIEMPFYWVQLSRAQDQGLQFWQTKSHAIIVHSPVPAGCIYRVISQNGDRMLFERLPYKFLCTNLIIRCVASDVSYPRLALPYKSLCTS